MASTAMAGRSKVGVLLLGSGWTSRFLLPRLVRENITHAYTTRQETPTGEQVEGSSATAAPSVSSRPITFKLDAARGEAETDAEHASRLRQACSVLPQARMIVVVFPLPQTNDAKDVARLVEAYEAATACTPAWLALGSTGAWGKGRATSSTPVLPSNTRAQAEGTLLSLDAGSRGKRRTAVLNLAGLYGHQRKPANFAKRVADSKEKLVQKTSVHLVHGEDVAQAIVGMYRALEDEQKCDKLWGRRWIVTDTHVYDWWQLLSTLRPPPVAQGTEWVKELMAEHGIESLPRPAPPVDDTSSPPHVLERVLDGTELWRALGSKPEIGRCDDYGPNGGGQAVESSL